MHKHGGGTSKGEKLCKTFRYCGVTWVDPVASHCSTYTVWVKFGNSRERRDLKRIFFELTGGAFDGQWLNNRLHVKLIGGNCRISLPDMELSSFQDREKNDTIIALTVSGPDVTLNSLLTFKGVIKVIWERNPVPYGANTLGIAKRPTIRGGFLPLDLSEQEEEQIKQRQQSLPVNPVQYR